MWFRLTGGNSSDGAEQNTPSPTTSEPSKFEKFRRASFRRKTSTSEKNAPSRKRSKSPHFILQAISGKSATNSVEEEDETDDTTTTGHPSIDHGFLSPPLAETKQVYKSEVDIVLKCDVAAAAQDDQKATKLLMTIPKVESTTAAKKPTLKSLKTEPLPKRKFYKNFAAKNNKTSLRRQNSHDNMAAARLNVNILTAKIEPIAESSTDEDSSDSDDEVAFDPPKNDDLSRSGTKEKMLLTDPKYKNNRIEKSSSKTKISGDLDKRESLKRSRSKRKIIVPAIQVDDSRVTRDAKKDIKPPPRTHTSLNFQALVKLVVNNKKFLNTDDFTLMRRKSVSEAASAVISVAATCKPVPIALKYVPGGEVADAPKEHDPKGERNVVLVKKYPLKNSFCERQANDTNNNEKDQLKIEKTKSKRGKEILKMSATRKVGGIDSAKVKRNSSNSSKSSGNFEDEAFYSFDEQDSEKSKGDASSTVPSMDELKEQQEHQLQEEEDQVKRKSSPSLTSRVAAKINETTNNYKNRKAAAASKKKRKTQAATSNENGGDKQQRGEFYKQISVERLNSTSIVRQPSDRRPDATNAGNNNISLRSNGSAAHNNSGELQSSFHASTAVAAGGDNGEVNAATGGASGAPTAAPPGGAAANDASALDASDGGKDSRRERLHQQHQQNKSAPVSVNRSESYKERLSHKRNRPSRRKTSDPSLTSRPNDDQADLGLSNSNYTASSNSSLSSGGGSESPSTSMEQVGGAAATATTAHHHHSASMHAHHAPHHTHQHSHQDSFHGSIGSGSSSTNTSFWGSIGAPNSAPVTAQLTRQWNFESDEEDDLMEADWSSNVATDMLAALSDAEKKRQEIINEIYQTERSHVRTLKLLDRLFYCPLQESGVLSYDHLMLLFPPALLSLRDLHTAFEQKLKQRRVEHNHIVNHVGDLLACMFDGQSGEELREHAAQFCARQQIALEALKEKRRKDEQLQKLLSKAESHKACRRLQLKDLLPTVLQRLTKYPLLFENLYKVTVRVVPQNTAEAEAIQRALESSKKILVDVNQAVKTAEDAHKLQNIQRKLDKSTFDKDEFKNLDLTQYRLIHDGSLTMKKNPSIQLHGLLFENMIVLLTKQDDKYSLKYLQAARNTEVNNKPVSPIMNIDSETLVRQEAADKNSFFLIKTKTSQMLELRAPSSSECKTWFKHISDAAEQYKPRSKNASHEPVDDPAIATIPHSNTKESLELAPERPPPISATATVTTTPLAPMMPPPTVTSAVYQNVINDGGAREVHMRNGRRESTPTPATDNTSNAYNHKQRLSQNDLLSTSVNRTMSTRSWGEPAANEPGVTLRHTQSARQAGASGDDVAVHNGASGGASNRNSASIVYSNNSNNTRTLMQSSPPLVEPTAIQISISPAHTAEPVLTPAEKLRRLDSAIRDGLFEKQKIICDMFRLPVEHFHEIVDIAAMPEAPKDSADIALAAYAQVQSLTEVVNEYMHVTPEQVISAVSTSVCDRCHEKQRQQRPVTPLNSSASASSASPVTQISAAEQQPPPLPPPNKQSGSQAQQQTPTPSVTKLQTTATAMEEAAQIHEDDDGYCEIDELRLPALPPLTHAVLLKPKSASPPPPLPPPAGTFKTPPPPPPPPANANKNTAANLPAELVKRQSTVSADSIPEESADEVIQAMDDGEPQKTAVEAAEVTTDSIDKEALKESETKKEKKEVKQEEQGAEQQGDEKSNEEDQKDSEDHTRKTPESKELDNTSATNESGKSELKAVGNEKTDKAANMEISDNFGTLASLNQLSAALAMIDCATQTVPLTPTLSTVLSNGTNGSFFAATPISATQCGPNRIQHASSLEPSVPCYALNSIVSVLNAQISLLLPKISERDNERDRLRKENQHLRELLNAMHERQRVDEKLETPNDITTKAAELEELFDADIEEVDSDFIAMLSGGSKANSNISSTTVEAEN